MLAATIPTKSQGAQSNRGEPLPLSGFSAFAESATSLTL
jgi:hypothetical protein